MKCKMKLVDCESVLNPLVVCTIDRSQTMVPVLLLVCVEYGLFYKAMCIIYTCVLSLCFSPFNSLFVRLFILCMLVYLFPLPLGVRDWL